MSKYPLFDYQQTGVNETLEFHAEKSAGDVMPVFPTGSGKTRIMAELGKQPGHKIYQAHRKELVGQIALALAKEDLPHTVMGDKKLRNYCDRVQLEKHGRILNTPTAEIRVISAQALLRRTPEKWEDHVRWFFSDEGHHGTQGSTWGKNRERYPAAFGVWPTATPIRTDGRGLGRHASGYIDRLILGPDMRTLINRQRLSDYDLMMDETDIDLTKVAIGKSGEYVDKQLAKALKESKIVGDTVESYIKYAAGMLTVVFTADVDLAEETAQKFRDAGIPAEAISSRNTDDERDAITRRFERRETLVLVNNDLLGEGYDVPEIECCIMDRPTESYALFVQQWGRALRYRPGKRALIIDKVGNLRKFLARGYPLPDYHYNWSLDDTERGSHSATAGDGNTVCTNVPACGWPYPASLTCCPFCGTEPVKILRRTAETVDGNLRLLTFEELEEMRKILTGKIKDPDEVRAKMEFAGAPQIAAYGAAKNIRNANEARQRLEHSINVWAGIHRDLGVTEDEAYKQFYALYGVDTLNALMGTAKEMQQLAERLHPITGV